MTRPQDQRALASSTPDTPTTPLSNKEATDRPLAERSRILRAGHDGEGDDAEWQPVSGLHDHKDAALQSSIDLTGHSVMDSAAITREIESTIVGGADDALSSGEDQRVRALRQLERQFLFRRHLVGDAALLARVEALQVIAPNFRIVTQLVRDAVRVSMEGGTPIRIPPLLLVGPAGIGKSRYARALASALATWVEEVSGSTLSDNLSLTGHDTSWRGAGMGRIAKALLASPTSAPLIFVDECEKVRAWDGAVTPLDMLLPAVEPHTAQRFQDDYLKVPMRADRVLWIFACNATDGLSAPFLDRVVVVPVDGLGSDGRDRVLRGMFGEVCQAVAMLMQLADDRALDPVRDLSLRRVRLAFEIAIARAVAADRRFVNREDVKAAVAILGRSSTRQPIGFVTTSQ